MSSLSLPALDRKTKTPSVSELLPSHIAAKTHGPIGASIPAFTAMCFHPVDHASLISLEDVFLKLRRNVTSA